MIKRILDFFRRIVEPADPLKKAEKELHAKLEKGIKTGLPVHFFPSKQFLERAESDYGPVTQEDTDKKLELMNLIGPDWHELQDYPPENPTTGYAYYDEKRDEVVIYDGSEWVVIGSEEHKKYVHTVLSEAMQRRVKDVELEEF